MSRSSAAQQIERKATKAEKFSLFVTARNNGATIALSCKAADISLATGGRYEQRRKQDEEREKRLAESMLAIAHKTEVAENLTERLRRCEDQYAAGIAEKLSKVMGYEAPTRSQVEVRQVPASVITWLDSLDVIDTNAQPIDAIAEPIQPKALTDKASEG